jgi:hypothetical protein
MNEDCPSLEELFNYIDQTLELNELMQIEQYLIDCSLYLETVDGARMIADRDEFRENAKERTTNLIERMNKE